MTPAVRSMWIAGAAASAGAGAIHLALGPEHVEQLGALGLGFFVAAGLQLAWAALAILRALSLGRHPPSRGVGFLVPSGIAINVAILVAWAVSRSIGLPAGQLPWAPESIGLSDAVASVFEGSLVVGLVAWRRGWRPTLAVKSRAMPLAGAALAIALISAGTVAASRPAGPAHTHGTERTDGTEYSHGTEHSQGSRDAKGAADGSGAVLHAEGAPAPRDAGPLDHHATDADAGDVHAPH